MNNSLWTNIGLPSVGQSSTSTTTTNALCSVGEIGGPNNPSMGVPPTGFVTAYDGPAQHIREGHYCNSLVAAAGTLACRLAWCTPNRQRWATQTRTPAPRARCASAEMTAMALPGLSPFSIANVTLAVQRRLRVYA